MHFYSKRCVCYAISVRLSVTLGYCVKTRECRKMRSSSSGSLLPLVYWCQEWLMGDDPVQVKFDCIWSTPCENSQAAHISPHSSVTVTDSEKSSVKVNRKLTTGLPMSYQPRSFVAPNFPKMGLDTQICHCQKNFENNIKSLLQSFIV